jgi:hypothetical protein
MKLALLVTAVATLFLTSTAQAAVLDMVPLATDVDGRTYLVEREFYSYGSEDDGYKYKGTHVVEVDRYTRRTHNYEMYFDCSDATVGTTVPTTEDVVSGTIRYEAYKRACLVPTKEPVSTKPLPIGIRPLN